MSGGGCGCLQEVVIRDLGKAKRRLFDILLRKPPQGVSSLTNALKKLLESLRTLLRSFNMVVQIPEVGKPIDPTFTRAAQSVVRTDLPDQTVIRVIRCGVKDTKNGTIVRQAEAIVSQGA